MQRDPRYDILFEPVRIGPVTAKNRFFQVPHCNGMGYAMPEAHAAMREAKAEGGWAVVSTEECEIHPTGDVSPYVEARLWDDQRHSCARADVREGARARRARRDRAHAQRPDVLEFVFARGCDRAFASTAEVRLSLAGARDDVARHPRLSPLASRRSDAPKRAGFDIVYIYAAHDLSLAMHFLQQRRNHRSDQYGGSLENRVRLLRELISDTKEAVGDKCAVAVRFATEEFSASTASRNRSARDRAHARGPARLVGRQHRRVAHGLADVALRRRRLSGAVHRLGEEHHQQAGRRRRPLHLAGHDGRADPPRRARLHRRGAPSIADPFLPRKIEEGRVEDIRECIGCNICVTGDMTSTPIRCTQNPTMGEEWRKGWHPERIAPESSKRVLVVGAGPAGLEAARALGQRGYECISPKLRASSVVA